MVKEYIAPHWQVWLSVHPKRTIEWLRIAVREGFEIHHIDGDHTNNSPDNLVLIEMVDHLRLHGFVRRKLEGLLPSAIVPASLPIDRSRVAELAYYARAQTGISWEYIGAKLEMGAGQTAQLAKMYARKHRLSWPLPLANVTRRPKRHPVYADSVL